MTADKIAEVVKSKKDLAQKYPLQKYPKGIPDAEFGKTMQSYSDIVSFIAGVLMPDSEPDESIVFQLTDEQVKNLYTTYENNMQKMANEYGKTPEQKKLLEKQYKKIKMPLSYAGADSWDTMSRYGEIYGTMLAVIIGFLAAGIFSEEFRTGAEAVFFSTKYGRTKATKSKIAAGMLMATIVYWVGMVILSLVTFGIMGVSGFDTPYQINFPYSIYSMTYGQFYILILVCGYIASLLAAAVAMLTAAKMHTASVAVCIPFFMYCMLPFIGRTLPSFSAFFNLMPTVLINVQEFSKAPLIFQVGEIAFRQIPFVMPLYTIVTFILLPFVYRSYCRYGLKRK